MKVFLQGMRRSGTTIAFDLFWEDARFDSYYEPFRENRPTPGGGSGAHSEDFMAKTLAARRAFMEKSHSIDDLDFFNYGAPRDPALEFENEIPEGLLDYLRFLLDRSECTLIKSTRMMCKVAALARLEPSARFIHLVRDPRLVATSYLFGKGGRNRAKFTGPDHFFSRSSEKSAWSSYPLSEVLLSKPEYRHLRGHCNDLARMLLLWTHNFRATHEAGQQAFQSNYLLVRHEDLLLEPRATVTRIYDFLGVAPSDPALEFVQKHLRSPALNYYEPQDPRWLEAFKQLEMLPQLAAAGYDVRV